MRTIILYNIIMYIEIFLCGSMSNENKNRVIAIYCVAAFLLHVISVSHEN